MQSIVKSKSLIRALSLYLGIVVAALISLFSLSGCADKCSTTSSYTTYRPVLASMSALRQEVDVLPPQQRENSGKIYIYGQYLLLGDPGKGIHVFDNSDKTNPLALSFINIPGNVDMAVRGGMLYVDSYIDLLVFNINDPTNITMANRIENVFPNYNNQFGVWVDGDQVVTALEELDIIDFTNDCADYNSSVIFMSEDVLAVPMGAGANPNMGSAPSIGIGGSTARFTIVNSYLYTVDEYMMHIFDILSPENPVDVNTVDLGWGIETIFPFKNNLFVGSQSGMIVYNIDNAAAPEYMTMVQHITACDPVVANDDYAFVTLRSENDTNWCGTSFANQLDVIDISDIRNARIVHTYPMFGPYGLGLDGNILFVTEGSEGLKIFDVTDVSKIDENLIQHMTGFDAYDVIPHNGTLILIGLDGLYQFDYTNIDEIKLLSIIPTAAV
jgi:hypothetical protein